MGILMGQIGWNDSDQISEIGTDANDGHTFIRAQLFTGRDITQPLTPARAQGTKLVCHLSGGLFRVPAKDTNCYIAFPDGMEDAPGYGMVIGTVEKTTTGGPGTIAFKETRAVMDFGDCDLTIVAPSVNIVSRGGDYIGVGQPRQGGASGITISEGHGSGCVFQEGVASMFCGGSAGADATTIIQMTTSQIDINVKGGGSCILDANGFACFGTTNWICGGQNLIGTGPTALTPIANGAAVSLALTAITTYIAALTAAVSTAPGNTVWNPTVATAFAAAGGTAAGVLAIQIPIAASISSFVSLA